MVASRVTRPMKRRRDMRRPAHRAGLALLLVLVALVGCASRRPPVIGPLRALQTRTPVIVVPGITGTALRDGRTGRLVWGNRHSLLLPRDGGYVAAHPLGPGADDPIEPASAIRAVRLLGPIRVPIYGPLIRLLQANGYRLGDLDAPAQDETFFLFPYDWRESHVEAAGKLARSLERLRRVRGEPILRVHLICQSNAAIIARYLVKYGGIALEEAEAGRHGPPPGVRVDAVILVGAANGGSLGTLRDLDRGRIYLPLIGRRFRQEVLFTFASLFEALPAPRADLFIDERGRILDVDLFDPRSWRTYGWSIYGRRTARRMARRPRPDLFSDAAGRAAHLARWLDRSARLHALLLRDVPGFDTRYYAVQNAYRPTPRRALLARRGKGWKTFFAGDDRIERDPWLSALADAPGDGHASLASQERLSPQEHAALGDRITWVPAYHRTIIRHPATQELILQVLLERNTIAREPPEVPGAAAAHPR